MKRQAVRGLCWCNLPSRGAVCGLVALLSFPLGSALTVSLMRTQRVNAESRHVYQLMIYHTKPGKVPELENIFRDVSKQQEEHGLHVIGYWVPDDPLWRDTFVYVVQHPSLDEAKKNWDALHSDPAFLPYRRAAEPLIPKVNGRFTVDLIYMNPTTFSALQ